MKENKRLVYLDILNIIACISVVFLHCNWEVHYYSNNTSWYISMFVETVCYFAVPVFLMITGANLLEYRKRYDDKVYFKKRFFKVVIPYFIWSIIFYIVYFKQINISDFTDKFLNCNIEAIYWFFPLIIWIYLIIPILSTSIENNKEKYLYYFGFLIFISTSCISFIFTLLNKSTPNIFFFFCGNINYILYIILGYYLSKHDIPKKKKIIIYILAILCLMFRYTHTAYFSLQENELVKNSWGYLTILSVITSSAIFIFFKNIKYKFSEKNIKIITKISGCSFGIYLLHILVRNKTTHLFNLNPANFMYKLIFPIGVYLISLLIVYILKKIPILKKIVP